MELVALACWRIDDTGFAFGSSFVTSETQDDFGALASMADRYPGSPLSIFGHADPVGDDAFNKSLSGNRALSIYGVLTRDTAVWESLYSQAGSSQGWGSSAISHMLAALGYDSVRTFQEKTGLQPVDSIAGKQTREKLFAEYMKWLCPRVWQKPDFLGRGADAQGKGDYQGCGEFNPALVFSQEESEEFSQAENRAERDRQNSTNRRVVVFFFRPGTSVAAEKWPCPRINESIEGCRKRLWSNGDSRRSPAAQRREYGQTGDTFACRFYDRLAYNSPCEGVEPRLVELIVPLERDIDGNPFQRDLVRLRQLDGGYESQLMEGDPDVRRDGENPLNFFHFQQVPPGRYAIDVYTQDTWRTILHGLTVSTAGAFYGQESFEDPDKGGNMGVPLENPAAPHFDEPTPDLGQC